MEASKGFLGRSVSLGVRSRGTAANRIDKDCCRRRADSYEQGQSRPDGSRNQNRPLAGEIFRLHKF